MSSSVHWDLVNSMWDIRDRPVHLQNKKVVSSMTLTEIAQFKANYLMEEEKKGGGDALFGKDQRLKRTVFEEEDDDGDRRLHEARFLLRIPIALPKKYWHRLPAKRPLFRHFPLAHLGMEGQVSETTVLRLHDRRVPIHLDMLYKGNATRERSEKDNVWAEPSEIRHLQEAVLNYLVILNALWPLDYAGFVVMRILVEARWGEAAGDSEKQRIKLVKKFFDDVMKENSGRAVRDQPPLDYEEAKSKWIRTIESLYPSLSLVNMNPALLLGKLQQQQQQQQSSSTKQSDGGTKQKSKDGAGRGRGGGRGRGRLSAGGNRVTAALNGIPCCYAFNGASGCSRNVVKQNVCELNGVHYVH